MATPAKRRTKLRMPAPFISQMGTSVTRTAHKMYTSELLIFRPIASLIHSVALMPFSRPPQLAASSFVESPHLCCRSPVLAPSGPAIHASRCLLCEEQRTQYPRCEHFRI